MTRAVTILLCTLDGERFLPQQLASYEAQTLADWTVVASDDGSKDRTVALLEAFKERHVPGRVQIGGGPRRGFVANFLQLACRPDLPGSYFAFSDQDDVWEPDKLERALAALASSPPDRPAAYCSRTLLIDQRGEPIGESPAFRRRPSFENALVQSIAGGNTFVFNEPLRQLLQRAGPDVRVPSHDWWVYLLATACGGSVHYDLRLSVRYRIHGGNEVGSNVGLAARTSRLRRLLQGEFRRWMQENIRALDAIRPCMTQEARDTLARFERARALPGWRRLWALQQSGVYRQTVAGNLGLFLGAAVNRI